MKIQLGFTLIEVLVSLLLFALILLTFDVMQLAAWRISRSAYFLTAATVEINSMSERLKTLGNKNGLEEQSAIWRRQIQLLFPDGKGMVSGEFPVYSLKLCWGKEKNMKCINQKVSV